MNKTQLQGNANKVKGKVKEITGKIIGNVEMEAKGKAQALRGKAQLAVGNVKDNSKQPTP